MALGAVGLHVLGADELRLVLLVPIVMHHVAEHGHGPVVVLAVTVDFFQTPALPVVTHRAAEIGELVPAFPAPSDLTSPSSVE